MKAARRKLFPGKRGFIIIAAAALLLLAPAAGFAEFPNPPAEKPVKPGSTAVAVLAGGCFWGMEGVFERLKGVKDVVSGYSGGEANTAQYEVVSTGSTGHAESIRVEYDPAVIAYGTLLKVYFSVAHDPTQFNYQGPDHGTQYRSAIFFATPDQKRVADEYIRLLDKAKTFDSPIVTQVVPLKAFYAAESYHQHFFDNNPDYPYIVYWDKPKVAALERTYPALVARK